MMDHNNLTLAPQGDEADFYKQVADLLASARKYAKKWLDNTIVVTYYEIGRMIVEHEQHGQKRAQYGAKLMKGLSKYLTEQYGRGFSVANLKNIRNFYQVYSPSIRQALIDNLQKFLLELGKGFLFEARQKRFSFDEKSFYVDLVFYNRLLRCYCLIDLKVAELRHQDLGQMLMYVHYFDRYVKTASENPTVGILLCSKKNDNIVELTLPEDSNIYASEYSLYLPDKALLQRKLAEWTAEFEETHGGDDK
jgi:predicted nuclease of restriction endonuclease-like (RecB) superfamily